MKRISVLMCAAAMLLYGASCSESEDTFSVATETASPARDIVVEQLIERSRRGDADAYGMLISNYAARLLDIYGYYGNKEVPAPDEAEIERLKVLAGRKM